MAAQKLSQQEAALLTSRYPQLPSDYISHLVTHGWGDTGNGKVLYNGPLEPAEVFGVATGPAGLLALGDDLAGYCFAYDPGAGVYGELDPNGRWQPWQIGRGLNAYVAA
ncbi:hypothetical protein [Xanthomonas campestris]|uniref:hypothetical protein n=1 Tax=Xanthomonas campestris TaxID=339 RepID=UPI0005AEEE39|nr:hypothetical protein [Xanthomonas campestris]KIQ25185.1 hypothetical protein RT95_14375 [Xanthomonas campestris]MCC5070317.1 hypothetical protein [Xanthomonas campestris]TXD45162.1 hypothetical protein TR80_001745 [Xanthomonas campestris]